MEYQAPCAKVAYSLSGMPFTEENFTKEVTEECWALSNDATLFRHPESFDILYAHRAIIGNRTRSFGRTIVRAMMDGESVFAWVGRNHLAEIETYVLPYNTSADPQNLRNSGNVFSATVT